MWAIVSRLGGALEAEKGRKKVSKLIRKSWDLEAELHLQQEPISFNTLSPPPRHINLMGAAAFFSSSSFSTSLSLLAEL